MAFLIAPPNTPGYNDTGVAQVNLYTTVTGYPNMSFVATPEEGGILPPVPVETTKSYGYVLA